MSARLWFKGIQELKIALANLPAELKGEATAIVMDSAQRAAADIKAQYPLGPPGRLHNGTPIESGNLRKGVKVVVKEIGPLVALAQVRSTAPHAHLYEFGTEARHYITVRGRRKAVGKMPAKPVFIPTMIRYRFAMYETLARLIEKAGLTVKRGTEAA